MAARLVASGVAGGLGSRYRVAAHERQQVYRLRAPASGREALAPIEPGTAYVDRETGEEMRPVTRTLPLAPVRFRASADPGEPDGSAGAATS